MESTLPSIPEEESARRLPAGRGARKTKKRAAPLAAVGGGGVENDGGEATAEKAAGDVTAVKMPAKRHRADAPQQQQLQQQHQERRPLSTLSQGNGSASGSHTAALPDTASEADSHSANTNTAKNNLSHLLMSLQQSNRAIMERMQNLQLGHDILATERVVPGGDHADTSNDQGRHSDDGESDLSSSDGDTDSDHDEAEEEQEQEREGENDPEQTDGQAVRRVQKRLQRAERKRRRERARFQNEAAKAAAEATGRERRWKGRVDQLAKQLEQAGSERIELNKRLAPLEKRLQHREDEIAALKATARQCQREAASAATALQAHCDELEATLRTTEEAKTSMEREVRRLTHELQDKDAQNAETFWQRSIAATRERKRLESELAEVRKEKNLMEAERDQALQALEEKQQEREAARQELATTRDELAQLRVLAERTQELELQLQALTHEQVCITAQLAAVQNELAETRIGHENEVEKMQREHSQEADGLRKELVRVRSKLGHYKQGVQNYVKLQQQQQQQSQQRGDGNTGDALDAALAGVDIVDMLDGLEGRCSSVIGDALSERDTQIERLEDRVAQLETERRKLHNIVQDLRGSIRVFLRVRPFLPSDGEEFEAQVAGEYGSSIKCSSDNVSVTVVSSSGGSSSAATSSSSSSSSSFAAATSSSSMSSSSSGMNPQQQQQHSFVFDHVFGPSAGQDDVFDVVSDFVQSALDGYRVCLLSYGQTGSGKTHTMLGSGNGRLRGIIPRSVERVADCATKMRCEGWNFQAKASFLEIYNEQLHDLLVDTSSAATSAGRKRSGTGLAIKRDPEQNNKVYVPGLTQVPLDLTQGHTALQLELQQLMAAAERTRSVASTDMNERSSRSHSVFTLELDGMNTESGTVLHGELHLVDLAGSERLNRSGVTADKARLRETQAINKSLSCLADVFTSLAQKSSHVPFRNSKLTYLLQNCLTGDGKALAFINLSPTMESLSESICSLRFAKQVSQVETGKPRRNVAFGSVPDTSAASNGVASAAADRVSLETKAAAASTSAPTTTTASVARSNATGTSGRTRSTRSSSRAAATSASSSSSVGGASRMSSTRVPATRVRRSSRRA